MQTKSNRMIDNNSGVQTTILAIFGVRVKTITGYFHADANQLNRAK
jgi:hypothetical protein